MNKMTVVKWYDPDTCDSIKLAAEAYGFEIKAAAPTGEPDEAYFCVYGPTESVDRFVNDLEDGDVEPFEAMRDLSDDEYQDWLSNALQKFGCLYIPTYTDERPTEETFFDSEIDDSSPDDAVTETECSAAMSADSFFR